MTNTPPAWTIVIAKSMQEEIAERSLRQAGYRVYLPRYRKLISPHGRERKTTTAMRPLFSGLLFVQDWRGWPQVNINGVFGLMQKTRAGAAATLSDHDVELVMRKERALEFDDVKYPPGRGRAVHVQVGDEVEIELRGVRVLAVLDDLSDDGKATVRGFFFGREDTRITILATDLCAISS